MLRVAVDALTQEAAGLHSALRGLRETVLPAQAESNLPHGTMAAELPIKASIAKSAAVYSSMDRTKNPANIVGQADKSCANTSCDRSDDSEPKPLAGFSDADKARALSSADSASSSPSATQSWSGRESASAWPKSHCLMERELRKQQRP